MPDFTQSLRGVLATIYCNFSIFWVQASAADVIKRYRFY